MSNTRNKLSNNENQSADVCGCGTLRSLRSAVRAFRGYLRVMLTPWLLFAD